MPARPSPLEKLVRRDRAVVVTGVAAISLVAWAYLFYAARGMEGAGGGGAPGLASGLVMPRVESWGIVDLLLLFGMWAVMMVAMMVPSAAPLVLTFARARRSREKKSVGTVVGSAGLLLVGYLLAWIGFSVLATLAQWTLHRAALLSSMMVSASPFLGAGLLVAAGAFQLTPLKRACLTRCRSPLSFLMSNWQPGRWGALVLGWKHGAYCVACCWMLMALLFVAGVMNLLWVAAIATFVLVEKVARRGDLVGRIAGVALIGAGVALLLGHSGS